jgi:phosphonoacetaldehyde hydrolase
VRTLQRVFAHVDVILTEAEIRRDMGLPKKDHIRGILSMERVKGEWVRLHGQLPRETDVDQL